MTKFTASREFEYHGKVYKEGDTVEVEEHVAEKLCKRGLGVKPSEEKSDPEVEKPKSKKEYKREKYKQASKKKE